MIEALALMDRIYIQNPGPESNSRPARSDTTMGAFCGFRPRDIHVYITRVSREVFMNRPLASVLAALLLVLAPARAMAADITVFAAASLADAMNEIARDYQKERNKSVAVSLAASSALARQIEASGGADIFISADLD